MKRKEIVILSVVIIIVIAGGLLFRSTKLHVHSLYGVNFTGDGAGGALAIYEDGLGGNIYAQKISPDGKLLWGKKGVLLGQNRSHFYVYLHLSVSSSGSGGALIEWEEQPVNPEKTILNHKVIVDSDGRIIFQNEDEIAKLSVRPETGTSGFRVTGVREEKAPTGDLRIQKPDSGWPEEGVLLGIDKAGGRPLPDDDRAVSDGAGGAIISWRDLRQRTVDHVNIFAQRVDRTGNLLWKAGGVNVSVTSPNPRSSMVGDGYGGAVVAYAFAEDGGDPKGLHIQKLDARGVPSWPENGLVITDGVYASQDMATDGQGGVIVGWGVAQGMFHGEQAYIQRIGPDGRLLWGEGGVRLK